jgi:hypothetical protein
MSISTASENAYLAHLNSKVLSSPYENIFKEMINISELYRVPFKPIENGIEVDTRRRMRKKHRLAFCTLRSQNL